MYEILAPAGNKESALAAIYHGANAIYLGYSSFSARAQADNFDFSGLKEIIDFAHVFGVKIYVTMNTMVKESEREEFLKTLLTVHNLGADGILLQDIFLGKYVHERYPKVCLHLSTQAGVNNVYGAMLAKEYGFSRVVLARETDIKDIAAITKIIETEVFVQGALCSCVSGQCYLSSFIGGNSGNRGRCKQPCRKKYTYHTGENKECYALSLADLCVGERVKDLLSAGVYSLKIEGRMRRPEYVAAAVSYYKKILEDKDLASALSDLKRTYNRGNYTQGLAFGQDKRFLSTAVQGHIGEKVGVVKVENGKYFVPSSLTFQTGDGFKILRSGEEVGGASFDKAIRGGFFISSRARLKNGDAVFITTDTALTKRLLEKERKVPLQITVTAKEGERLQACCNGVTLSSDFLLQTAKNCPLSEKDIVDCFLKVDELPVKAEISAFVTGNSFVAKSQLNEFRRAFYQEVKKSLSGEEPVQYEYKAEPTPDLLGQNDKIAVMGSDLTGISADIYIVKPNDYAGILKDDYPMPEGESYLYLPAFLSGSEIEKCKAYLKKFDGIYADGTYAIPLAKELNKKLFAGTGFNLSNAISVGGEFDYYVLSKELDFNEAKELSSERSFVLSAGSLKVMDFAYCPFGRKCSSCENKDEYALTDEGDRAFTLRRYKTDGLCRFELYNCAYLLSAQTFTGSVIDLSTIPMPESKRVVEAYPQEEKIKTLLHPITSGHSKKSVL